MTGNASTPRLITWRRVLCALVLAAIATYLFPARRFIGTSKSTAPQPLALEQTGDPSDLDSPFGHPYYRYSVIPGGIFSREELENALASDNVAAGHYSDFDLDDTRVVTLDHDHSYYVSYRVGDRIYWTRHPVTLHKGEKVLTDGVHLARARCGNRLLDHPPTQTAKLSVPAANVKEPAEKVFNAPVAIQMSLSLVTPSLDPGPDMPFEMASMMAGAQADSLSALNNLMQPSAPAAPPEAVDYVPTRHDRVTLFALDSQPPMAMLPILYPAETPSAGAVPEPGTAALEAMALLSLGVAGAWSVKRSHKSGRLSQTRSS